MVIASGTGVHFTQDQLKVVQDHSACGVGFVASENAIASNEVLRYALNGLSAMEHRGGVASDIDNNGEFKATTDGTGITVEVDQDFWKHKFKTSFGEGRLFHDGGEYTEKGKKDIGIGVFFLPRDDREKHNRCRAIIEEEFAKKGYEISERQAPLDDEVLGTIATKTHPRIWNYAVLQKDGVEESTFDADLYVIRRRIEKRVKEEQLSGQGQNRFYIPSLSRHIVTYKGLSLAHQLDGLYRDLAFNPKLVKKNKDGSIKKDLNYRTRYAIFHRRYATNTAPTWERAHPYHSGVAHNGEINSLATNVAIFKQRLEKVFLNFFSEELRDDLKDVINMDGTDSAQLADVVDFLVHAGMSAEAIKSALVPEAMMPGKEMSDDVRAMYEFIDAVLSPWDGPNTMIFTDRQKVLIGGDRSGFRPIRVARTKDGIVVGASEDGILQNIPNKDIIERPSIEPGEMLAVDFINGGIIRDQELKERAARQLEEKFGYKELLSRIVSIPPVQADAQDYKWSALDKQDDLLLRQRLGGFSSETVDYIKAMATTSKPPLGSMGDDAPMPMTPNPDGFVYRPFTDIAKQKFAQVTNPPLDTIRERAVTSLKTFVGFFYDFQGEKKKKNIFKLDSPILLNSQFQKLLDRIGEPNIETLDCSFDLHGDSDQLEKKIKALCWSAEGAARQGFHIVLTDEKVGPNRVRIPMLLIAGAIHSHLERAGLRGQTSINVRTAEAYSEHDFAALIGLGGVNTVNAYMAEDTIAAQHAMGAFGAINPKPLDHYIQAWKTAAENGLLKIMGKMGVSHISSYRGGRLFTLYGISKTVRDLCFPGTANPLGGLDLEQIQERECEHHRRVYAAQKNQPLHHMGRYHLRGGTDTEPHALTPEIIDGFQEAVKQDNFEEGYATYKEKYTKPLHALSERYRIQPRDYLHYNYDGPSIDINEVESRDSIINNFVTGSMSRGSISQEAHETLAIAASRKGFKSSSGEGGEDPERYGTEKRSKIKQFASARFGVTLDYILDADEIEIKLAQGAKPGEGGELPGGKVTLEIAKLRHCKPGTPLISPSTHHDIYSIEDLEQLIFNIKQANPKARVKTKLVAADGVDVIAAGCAKAGADEILLSGGNGGTGASPQSSIVHAGEPWEVYLNKTHQKLSELGFRTRVKLGVDGGIRTGRDVVIGALMGAETFGFGLQALIAEGCRLVRACHIPNGCPFKIASNVGEFVGTPEMVMNMMDFIAEEIREDLAKLGLKSLDEAVGRTDLLKQVYGQDHGYDLSGCIMPPIPGQAQKKCELKAGQRNDRINPKDPEGLTLDQKILKEYEEDLIRACQTNGIFETPEIKINNEDRAAGARLAGILRQAIIDNPDLGRDHVLQPDSIVVKFNGEAGQALGYVVMQGIKIDLTGSANDGVGASLSGGTITVRPDPESPICDQTQVNQIIGNHALYGATSGLLFAAGKAGSRFGIRLSGAVAVVEGTGYEACNFMTGGTAIILGDTGQNFAAGMSGGDIFIYDPNHKLKSRIQDIAIIKKVQVSVSQENLEKVRGLVTRHFKETGSKHAKKILDNWAEESKHFRHVQGYDEPAQANPVLAAA